MRILAFDLGRHTGWAVLDQGELRTGSFIAQGQDEASVFIFWSQVVSHRIRSEHPEAIAFEDVTFNRGRSYIPGMKALLFVKAAHEGLTCFGVDVNTLKAFAHKRGGGSGYSGINGKWRGTKDDMRAALIRSGSAWDSEIRAMDDNEVDAAWAAIWLDENATEVP